MTVTALPAAGSFSYAAHLSLRHVYYIDVSITTSLKLPTHEYSDQLQPAMNILQIILCLCGTYNAYRL